MTNDNPAHDLGDRLSRLAGWADQTSPQHHDEIGTVIDALTTTIAQALDMGDTDLGLLDPKVVRS